MKERKHNLTSKLRKYLKSADTSILSNILLGEDEDMHLSGGLSSSNLDSPSLPSSVSPEI